MGKQSVPGMSSLGVQGALAVCMVSTYGPDPGPLPDVLLAQMAAWPVAPYCAYRVELYLHMHPCSQARQACSS